MKIRSNKINYRDAGAKLDEPASILAEINWKTFGMGIVEKQRSENGRTVRRAKKKSIDFKRLSPAR